MASNKLSVYLGSGDIADRPATPDIPAGMSAWWFSDDTGVASVYTTVSGWTDVAGGGGGGDYSLPLTRALVPQISSWTALNLTGAVTAEKTAVGGFTKALKIRSATSTASSSPNLQGYYRAAPTPPYRVVCGFYPPNMYQQYPGFMFGFYDGTKLLTVVQNPTTNGQTLRLITARYNSVTSAPSEPFANTTYAVLNPAGPNFLAWENDGTNLKAQTSSDTIDWDTFYSETVGAFLSNRNYLVMCVNNNFVASGKTVTGTAIEWDEDGLNRTLDNVNFGT